ncbi:MAG TPA: hypothetical protein VNJ08_09940 [Bacteriovoracaceae bacterium]|nr:hypothetical protein [Bacteriovoracaceae bacterium]
MKKSKKIIFICLALFIGFLGISVAVFQNSGAGKDHSPFFAKPQN